MAATQKELGDARRDLITAQNNAEAMMTADAAESRDSTTFISVALQQRDAAVAAEVAAVGRAQNLQVRSCSIFPVLSLMVVLLDTCVYLHDCKTVHDAVVRTLLYLNSWCSKLIGSTARQGDRVLLQR